jgi:uncharacterized protein Veg
MRLLFSILVLVFLTQVSFAQGRVEVNEEQEIMDLMNSFVDINSRTYTVDGWRIQLMATSDRSKVENAKRRFQTLYPNIFVVVCFEKRLPDRLSCER